MDASQIVLAHTFNFTHPHYINCIVTHVILQSIPLQVTDSVSFGNVTVAGTARRCVKVWNTGELPVSCSWRVATPFAISPASAMLAAGASGTSSWRFIQRQLYANQGHPALLTWQHGASLWHCCSAVWFSLVPLIPW